MVGLRRAASWPVLLSGTLALFAAGQLLYRPIVAYDADLWYHLNAGRFIFEHGRVPREAFFSFLAPPRPWRDYYWLFQALVFGTFRLFGYGGLIALRTCVYGALAWFLRGLLVKDRDDAAGALALAVCLFFLMGRFFLVRPHLFSYLLIAVSLRVLESRKPWTSALPAVGLLWGNLHGGSYPVFLLILGAYAAEDLVRGRRDRLAGLALAAIAVFATPLGASLAKIPYMPLGEARRAIMEYRLLTWHDLTWLSVRAGAIDPTTAFNLILLASLAAALTALARGRARLSHAALLVGGLALLCRGDRFRFECVLLFAPTLRDGLDLLSAAAKRRLRGPAGSATLAGLFAVLFLSVTAACQPRQAYPFSRRQLPEGVAAFLRRTGSGGDVLADPASAGYLEWALHPSYRVAADMQVPYLFSAEDFFAVAAAFQDGRALAALLARYHPDYIAAPLSERAFPGVIQGFPRYQPVFFDDVAALYVDAERHPEIARVWRLAFDPYDAPMPDPRRERALPSYLSRMIEVDSGCLKTRWRAALFCAARGDFAGELAHAEAVIGAYPESPFGYQLKSQALAGLKRP